MIDRPEKILSKLRKKAEALIAKKHQYIYDFSQAETSEVIYDLHVHKAALEMQNDELRVTRHELKNSRDRFSQIYNQAPIGFLTIDNSGIIQLANQTLADMLDIDFSQLRLQPFSNFIDPRDKKIFLTLFKPFFLMPEDKSIEIRLIKRDGSSFYANLEGRKIKSIDLPCEEKSDNNQLLIVISDITRRVRAENAMRNSEERLNSIVKTIPDIIYRLDKKGNITFISDAVKKYAYSSQELNNTNILQLVHPDDREKAIYRINERRTGERGSRPLEIRLFMKQNLPVSCKDKSTERTSESVFLITAEGLYESELPETNTFVGTQGIARDITERKSLEDQLRQAQKMEAIGTLAGGLAHDFNNLLMSVQGNVSLMLMHNDTERPHYELLKEIEKHIQSGARLTSHLLGYARKGKYELKTINLNKLVQETSENFNRTRKAITIHRKLAENLFAIEAEPRQIMQVLLNLFVNAADAMPDGGTLILKTMNTTHTVIKSKLYSPKPANYVLLMVSDTGTGMGKKVLERIFDPFFTTKEMGRGTGLGLASTYGIIKSHGGYITVDSLQGHGSTFKIYLPASEKQVEKNVENTVKFVRGTGTVLLVDDEEAILKVGKKMLNVMGYNVLTANDRQEIIEICTNHLNEIEIVILDMIMPSISGSEVYDHIKKINPNIKVLLSSGYSIDSEAGKIMEKGCNGFIQKPFSIEELSCKINDILGS